MNNNSYSNYRKGSSSESRNVKGQKSSPKNKPGSLQKQAGSDRSKTSGKNPKTSVQGRPTTKGTSMGATKKNVPKQSKEELRRQKEDRARQKREQRALRKSTRQENVRTFKLAIKDLLKKAFYVILLALLIGETILMLNQNAVIDNLKFSINDINTELEKENNVLKELNSKKETALKSETIENIARYNLGMIYPTKEQTIYINLD